VADDTGLAAGSACRKAAKLAAERDDTTHADTTAHTGHRSCVNVNAFEEISDRARPSAEISSCMRKFSSILTLPVE